ncbi:X-box-binding protein 1 [Ditylenchus destructor]|uniref:X-box-binding protein 1 n=1 Tax=Ditylenchus destructor TaxID=166010 RepID=A0AAD4R8E6_9BILA|nr:X-box-binding protein 1 [Ditylenchus destructor]
MAPPPRTIYIVPARNQSRPRVHMASGGGPAILSRPQVATRPAPVFRPIATPNQHSQRPPKKQQFHDDHGYAGAIRQISQSVSMPNPVRVQPKTFPMTQPIQSKKRKLDYSEERAVVPETYGGEADELVDIAEVYQLLGEHFGPDEYTDPPLPRKRERLTNLSKEEKLHRRKLKNRVAAQTARDRKKERSIRLEKVVRALLHETTNLRADNAKMQRELQQLRAQQQMWQLQGSMNENSSNTLQNVQFSNNTPQPILSSPSSQSYLPEVITDNVGSQIQHSPRMGAAGNMVKVEAVETFGSAESINDRLPCERHASRDEFNFEHKVEGIVEDEDRELESIFDDLFGDSTSQQTIDEFCNQVIEDEIAAEVAATSATQGGRSSSTEMASPEATSFSTTTATHQPAYDQQTLLTPQAMTSSNYSIATPSLASPISASTEDNGEYCWLSSQEFSNTSDALLDGYDDTMLFTTDPGHSLDFSQESYDLTWSSSENSPESHFETVETDVLEYHDTNFAQDDLFSDNFGECSVYASAPMEHFDMVL